MENSYLKNKSLELPNDGSQYSYEALQIRNISNQLSVGLKYINCGGCGMFAIMLDSIFNGSIVQLRHFLKENRFERFGYESHMHEFLIKEGFCHDALDTCNLDTLFRVKKLKEIITTEKIEYKRGSHRFLLIDRNPQSILDEYQKRGYNQTFANKRFMSVLYANYVQVLKSLPDELEDKLDLMKVNNIINHYEPVIMSLAA